MYFIVQDDKKTIECVYDDSKDWFEILFQRLNKYNNISRKPKMGFYLTRDGVKATLYKREYQLSKGYLYNSTSLVDNVVNTFRYMEKGQLDVSGFIKNLEEPLSCKSLILVDKQIDIHKIVGKFCEPQITTVIADDRTEYDNYHIPNSCSLDELEMRLRGRGCVVLDIALSALELERIVSMQREIPLIIRYQTLEGLDMRIRHFDYIFPYKLTKKDASALSFYFCEMSADLDAIINDVNNTGQLIIVNKHKPTFYRWTFS